MSQNVDPLKKIRENGTGKQPTIVKRDWLIDRVVSETFTQDPVLAKELRPLKMPGGIGVSVGSMLKIWFGVRCKCTTAAVLSVEVGRKKTEEEVIIALPQIVDRLRIQYRGFTSMSCDNHEKMRSDYVKNLGRKRD